MKVKVTQSPPTLCDPMDCIVHGILQARILEWVAFPFSKESSQPRDQTQVSYIASRFFTCQATREAQEYWSRQPVPSPADLPNPGIKPGSPALQANSLPTELLEKLICGILANYSTNMWNLKRKLNSNKQRAECWCYEGQKRGGDGVIKGYLWGCSYI